MTGAPSTGERPRFHVGDLPAGRILDEALELVRYRGWAAAAVGLIPVIPIWMTYLLIREWLWWESIIASHAGMHAIDWLWTALTGGLVLAPLAAGMYYILATAYLGRPVPVRAGFLHAAACWPWIAPVYLVFGALIYPAFHFLCYLPGMLLAFALYLHLAIMSLDRIGPLTAIGRGFFLMGGRVGTIFIIVMAHSWIDLALSMTLYSLSIPYLYPVLLPLLSAPVTLYFVAVTTVVYISARSRHESIDLQILADDIAAEAGAREPLRL